jgi:hypothetical protein
MKKKGIGLGGGLKIGELNGGQRGLTNGKYPSLCFSLRFAEGGEGFSGVQTYVDGVCVEDKVGECGEYYGGRYCQNCQGYITWECCDTDWKHEFDMCEDCFDEACKTIKSAVRAKKIKKLPQRLACLRMGRNPIMDNYLMRKVFVPRLNDCIA